MYNKEDIFVNTQELFNKLLGTYIIKDDDELLIPLSSLRNAIAQSSQICLKTISDETKS